MLSAWQIWELAKTRHHVQMKFATKAKKRKSSTHYELVCADFLKYASSLHTYNTSYAASQNLYKSRVRTTTGKQTISYMASIFCHNAPSYLKNLNVYQFSKQIKLYPFSELENSMK